MSVVGKMLTLNCFSRLAGASAVLVGGVVLLAWYLNIPQILTLLSGLASMKPNTALCFILAGVSLALLAGKPAGRPQRVAESCGAALVLFIAILTLLEYVLGWNLGIDEVLVRMPFAGQGPAEYRMALGTAFGFLLAGLAMLLHRLSRPNVCGVVQGLALALIGLSLVALMGYVYGVESLYRVYSYASMALHTALTFLIVGIGILCLAEDQSLLARFAQNTPGAMAARRLLPVALGFQVGLGWLCLQGHRLGYYSPEFGIALLVGTMIFVSVGLTWWIATSLDHAYSLRQAMEAALRESEENFRSVAETASDAIVSIDEQSRILFANQAVEQIFGYSPSELLGQRITLLMPEYLRKIHESSIERYVKTGKRHMSWHAIELPGLHRSGFEIPLELSFGEQVKEGGHIFTGIIRDVTQRKRAQESLRESEQRYRELFENANDVLYTLDPEGRLTSLNRAGEQMLGVRREDALGQAVERFVAPEYLERMREMMNHKLHGGQTRTTYELEVLSSDGRRVPIEVNTTLILRDGSVAGIEGVARDVSDRKRLEDQLRQAQKMEAVGQLAGGVAHDFNNLLTAILGNADLLMESLATESSEREEAQEIVKAANRAADLTRQLLAFSRRQMLQPQVLNLTETVADSARLLGRLIGEHIQLSLDLDPELGRVKVDPSQIQLVMMNLVVNARDAMPEGGSITMQTANVTLDDEYVRGHPSVSPGPYVMLAVSDTGEGMDVATQARVFEPFFTTKEQGRGTGLGLSMVYGIVKQSGGSIWVYSAPGLGTTFKIYLPRVDEPTAVRMMPPAAEPETKTATETILLVEDEESVRQLVFKALRLRGYRVLLAADADQALRLVNEHRGTIHMILTDVVMPHMSGTELVSRLCALRSSLKVVFMSGYSDGVIDHHGFLDGGRAFIQKPFTPELLARKVREVLDQ